MEAPSLDLVAVSRTPDGSRPVTKKPAPERETLKPPSHFTSVQWSADGTTLFTTSSEARLSTYVVPANLLDPRDPNEPLALTPQGTLVLADNLGPVAPCPYWSLHDPSTQLVLTASKEQPIQLYHPFQSPAAAEHQRPLASYFQINPLTEAYAPITALLWPAGPSAPTSNFYTGSHTSEIAVFDISRPGSSSTPIAKIATVWKTARKVRVGLRGAISALSVQAPDSSYGAGGYGLLAAGTWARGVGVYDLNRTGACVTSWTIGYSLNKWSSSATTGSDTNCGTGQGITQILWSPCGRYMVVNERCTTALLVYDVRETYQLVARLIGRRIGAGNALQRLQADVYPGSVSIGGFEVWSGTGDGGLVVWEGVGLKQGDIKPSWEKRGITDGFATAVSGAVMHKSGSVVATVSGSWTIVDDDSDSDSDSSDSDSDSESDSSEDKDEDEKDDDVEKNKNGDSSDSDSDSESESESDSSEDEEADDGEKQKDEGEPKGKDRDESTSMDISDTSSESSSDSSSSSSSEKSYHPKNKIVVKETSLKIWSIRAANPVTADVASEVVVQEQEQEQEEEEVVDEWGRVRRCDTSYGEDGGSRSSLPPRSPTPVPMD